MNTALLTTLRFSLLDLRRSRWLAMVAASIAIALGAGVFAGQLGLTEQQRIAIAIAAPLARILAVLVVIVLIVATLAREASERSRQLALSAAISREAWIVAKWSSFIVMAGVTALACGVAIGLLAPDSSNAQAALSWTASLALELSVVASIALTVSLAIPQVAAATLATLAIYTASRVIGVILLLDSRSSSDAPALGALIDWPLQMLGLLLPRLDLFARTDWLIGAPVEALGAQAVQAAIYCALMLAVASFDFCRQELQ